ncbi:cytochrome P450 [Calocera cornea HHB12733]|uniref:Cytochrome P450 n=1 Tax=Calocera cornea HHB12733 TaxID=1353952 RepID=A0A165EA95_9BASI|nr:cytochrome P450 [Calocera cornea HHB12733]
MGNLLGTAILLPLALALLIRAWRPRPAHPFPPGPKGVPFLGSVFEVPTELLWVKLVEWYKEYGPIYSYTVLGQRVVVISGLREAGDILDRMSAKTSDRSRLIKVHDYLTRGKELGLLPRNDVWRAHRRAAHESFNSRAAQDYHLVQEEESRVLVKDLLNHPGANADDHIFRFSTSIAWRASFGHELIPLEGPDPSLPLQEIFKAIFTGFIPGNSIVDLFPFLNPIIARSKFIRRSAPLPTPLQSVRDCHCQTRRQVLRRCHCLFRQVFFRSSGESITRRTDTSITATQVDGTMAALRWFLVAMILYPEAALAAREQLDRVLGDRPPTFADYEELPQIEALVKELLRWRPPTPAGLVHMASEDIIYDGFLIPKGAVLMPNAWSLCRDPSVYPAGEAFDPSGFLDDNGNLRRPPLDTHDDYPVFGHGRRICVGRALAKNSLWISIACVLWAFDIEKGVDEHGVEVTPDPLDFIDHGVTVWPKSFPVKLVPRYPDLADRLKPEPA